MNVTDVISELADILRVAMLNYTRTDNSNTDIRSFIPEAAIRDKTLLDQHCKFPVAPLATQSNDNAEKMATLSSSLVIYSICTGNTLMFFVLGSLGGRPIPFETYLM